MNKCMNSSRGHEWLCSRRLYSLLNSDAAHPICNLDKKSPKHWAVFAFSPWIAHKNSLASDFFFSSSLNMWYIIIYKTYRFHQCSHLPLASLFWKGFTSSACYLICLVKIIVPWQMCVVQHAVGFESTPYNIEVLHITISALSFIMHTVVQ